MDLSDFNDLVEGQDRGAELVIRHPVTSEPTDIKFFVAGPDSTVQRNARIRMQDDLIEIGHPTAEERDRLSVELLARCVVHWEANEGGEPVAFTFTNVCRVLKKFAFIREQVDAFAASRSAYLMKDRI